MTGNFHDEREGFLFRYDIILLKKTLIEMRRSSLMKKEEKNEKEDLCTES